MLYQVSSTRRYVKYRRIGWHCDAKFGHEMANGKKATGHGHFLEMKNSAYYFPYYLANNKVNAIYMVYKIRKYDGTGTEHNYLFSYGMGGSHHGICFHENGKTMRVHIAVGDMDISLSV